MIQQKFLHSARLILGLILIAIVGVPYLLMAMAEPMGGDSGVFLYGGYLITLGDMPYKDFWDHKGPFIYLINALGYLLQNNASGVIFLEGISLIFGLSVSALIWLRLTNKFWVGFVVVATVLTYYNLFVGGNYVETWLFPFQLISYSCVCFMFYQEKTSPKYLKYLVISCIVLGISIAIALLLRPNNSFGLIFAAGYLLFLNRHQRYLVAIIYIASCFLPICLIIYWLNYGHAINAFYDQYIEYNLYYSNSGVNVLSRIRSTVELARLLLFSPIGILASSAVFLMLTGARLVLTRNTINLSVFTLIFVIDFISQNISGHSFPHYCIVALPAIVISLIAFNHTKALSLSALDLKPHSILFTIIFIFVLLISSLGGVNMIYGTIKSGINVAESPNKALVDYLERNSRKEDQVLMHGEQGTWLLAATKKLTPTKITYILPILSRYKDLENEYTNEIMANKPRFIIETPDSCGLSRATCNSNKLLFRRLKHFVEFNYQIVGNINNHLIWRLNSKNDLNKML